MTLLEAMARHELLTQRRSLRFRVLAGAHLLLSLTPVIATTLLPADETVVFGPASRAASLHGLLPIWTALFAGIISLDAVTRERDEGSLLVVSLTDVSSAGYVLRRWLSLQVLLLPASALPVAVATAVTAATGSGPTAIGAFWWPWLLHVVPVTLAASALALGVGAAFGGSLPAAIGLGLVLGVGFGLGNEVLGLFGRRLTFPALWLVADSPLTTLWQTTSYSTSWGSSQAIQDLSRRVLRLIPATDAPYDPRAAAATYFTRGLIPLGLAAAALGISCAYLRRAAPDVRPWRISERHPFRTFLGQVNRARVFVLPDPLTGWDRLAVAGGLVALAAVVSLSLSRATAVTTAADQRAAVLADQRWVPTDVSLVPTSWTVRGEVRTDGLVTTSSALVVRNDGTVPATRLALSLTERLGIRSTAVETGDVRVDRAWDRVEAILAPPLEPGESRELRFEVHGTPGNALPPIGAGANETITDRSLLTLQRAASQRRIFLAADELAPVPRYTPWKLASNPLLGRQLPEMLRETVRHPTLIEVELSVPDALRMANACGSTSVREQDVNRLRGTCRLPLPDFIVAGTQLVEIEARHGDGTVLALASHVAIGESHARAVETAGKDSRTAWPGRDPVHGVVVMEWPPAFRTSTVFTRRDLRRWNDSQVDVYGRLCLVPESLWIQRRFLPTKRLAAELLVADLSSRRSATADDQPALRALLAAIARAQLGSQRSTATSRNNRWVSQALSTPLVPHDHSNPWVVYFKVPKLVQDLQHRIGARALRDGVERYLATVGPPGTTRALFQSIGREADIDLGRFHSDFVSGGSVPILTIADAESTPDDDGWTVAGAIENEGDGLVECDVVVTTDGDAVVSRVVIDGPGRHAFKLRSSHRPRDLQLDPRERCYRIQHSNATLQVALAEGS